MPGQKITRELLLRRAEHNDGQLSDLKEITLHQFDLEKIQLLDVYCKKLQIVFLQNNQISKIENLNKLKDLEYLNLALNNITKIENLQSCESLRKLDLTLNFVDDLFCVESLAPCLNLRELYLTGNPVASKQGYREFVICTLPHLINLDGRPVVPSERLSSMQMYTEIKSKAKLIPVHEYKLPDEDDLVAIDSIAEQDLTHILNKNQHSEHTPESRIITARHMNRLRELKTPKPTMSKLKQKKPDITRINPEGKVMQCNEPHVAYTFIEANKNLLVLEIKLSKLIDTSLVDLVTLDEAYIWLTIISKRLILRHPSLIDPDRVCMKRSLCSGVLSVYMAIQNNDSNLTIEQLIQNWHDDQLQCNQSMALDRKRRKKLEIEQCKQKLADLDLKRAEDGAQNLTQKQSSKRDLISYDEIEMGSDEDEIPPLV